MLSEKVKSHFQPLLFFPLFSFTLLFFVSQELIFLLQPFLHYESLYFIVTRLWSYFTAFSLCFYNSLS